MTPPDRRRPLIPPPRLSDAPPEVMAALHRWERDGAPPFDDAGLAHVWRFSRDNIARQLRLGRGAEEIIEAYIGDVFDLYYERIRDPKPTRWAYLRVYRWVLRAAAEDARRLADDPDWKHPED